LVPPSFADYQFIYASDNTPLDFRFQARVSQASSLGVDLPVLLKVFQAPPASAASPLMQASAAPVNMMAQCVANSLLQLQNIYAKQVRCCGRIRVICR
jgi:hypothetical protein